MMKMAGRVVWCCLALLLTLNSASAIQRLNTIGDLKKIDFGGSVPTHSLVLLYWFAHTVTFGYNDIQLTFNPRGGEYGSHYFHNYENLLAHPPWGQRYFIIGNVDQNTLRPLPDYVVRPPSLFDRGNRDRIIIRVNGGVIEQVYLTQHYGNANLGGAPWYDPNHTYEITTNLLRQVREFPQQANVHTLQQLTYRYGGNINNVINMTQSWGGLASLVLFFYIVTQMNFTFQFQSRRTENKDHESWNRGSSHHYTQQPSDNNICSLLFSLLVILCVGAFLFLMSKLPRV